MCSDDEQQEGNSWEAFLFASKYKLVNLTVIRGNGVDFMEFDDHWHSKEFALGEARNALTELRSLGGRITGEHE